MVLPSLFLESIKNQKLYLLFLQSSAARPQAYEPASVQIWITAAAKTASGTALRGLDSENQKHRAKA